MQDTILRHNKVLVWKQKAIIAHEKADEVKGYTLALLIASSGSPALDLAAPCIPGLRKCGGSCVANKSIIKIPVNKTELTTVY